MPKVISGWDDLEMVSLRRTTTNGWSFTVYADGFRMVLSNRDLPDVFACLEQILGWMGESVDASGGMKSEPAVHPAQIIAVTGELNDPPMVLKVSSRRPRGKKRRTSTRTT